MYEKEGQSGCWIYFNQPRQSHNLNVGVPTYALTKFGVMGHEAHSCQGSKICSYATVCIQLGIHICHWIENMPHKVSRDICRLCKNCRNTTTNTDRLTRNIQKHNTCNSITATISVLSQTQ